MEAVLPNKYLIYHHLQVMHKLLLKKGADLRRPFFYAIILNLVENIAQAKLQHPTLTDM